MIVAFLGGSPASAPQARCLHPRLLAWMSVLDAYESGLFKPSTLEQADLRGVIGFRADQAPRNSAALFCPDCRFGEKALTGAQELDLQVAALRLFGLGAPRSSATMAGS